MYVNTYIHKYINAYIHVCVYVYKPLSITFPLNQLSHKTDQTHSHAFFGSLSLFRPEELDRKNLIEFHL